MTENEDKPTRMPPYAPPPTIMPAHLVRSVDYANNGLLWIIDRGFGGIDELKLVMPEYKEPVLFHHVEDHAPNGAPCREFKNEEGNLTFRVYNWGFGPVDLKKDLTRLPSIPNDGVSEWLK